MNIPNKEKLAISDFAQVPPDLLEECQAFDASFALVGKTESKIAFLETSLLQLKEFMPNEFAEAIYRKNFLSDNTIPFSTVTAAECFSAIDQLSDEIELILELVADNTSKVYSLDLPDPYHLAIEITGLKHPFTAIGLAYQFKVLHDLAYWFTTLKDQAINFLKPYALEQTYCKELAAKMVNEQKSVVHIKGDSCYIPVEKSISVRKDPTGTYNILIGKEITHLLNQILKKKTA